MVDPVMVYLVPWSRLTWLGLAIPLSEMIALLPIRDAAISSLSSSAWSPECTSSYVDSSERRIRLPLNSMFSANTFLLNVSLN